MEKQIHLADNQFEELKVLLNELKNFSVIMQKLMKNQEYNEISDMTNQVFEMRLSNIEDFLFRLDMYVRNKTKDNT